MSTISANRFYQSIFSSVFIFIFSNQKMFYFDKNKLLSLLKRRCLPFYCIWCSKRKDTWRKSRYLSSALAGTFCACLICKLILASFEIPKKYENYILYLTILIIGMMLENACPKRCTYLKNIYSIINRQWFCVN